MDRNVVHVLLIEDSPTYALLVRRMLSGAEVGRFEVEVAERLSEGIERIGRGDVDVVLLDLTLPDSQGLASFTRLRSQAGEVPVVVLTGVDDERLALATLQRGAADYLVKGEVNGGWLVRALRYAVERSRAEKAAAARRGPAAELQGRLDIHVTHDVALVRFLDRKLVSPNALERTKQSLFRLIEQVGCRKLLLNFANVEYFPNAAMGMLLVVDRKLKSARGTLRLCNVSPEVKEHFATRHLDGVFDFWDQERDALDAF